MASGGIRYDSDSVFAKIVRGELPCVKLFETLHAIAILDAFPMVKGHALLIPKAGFPTLADCPPAVAADVLRELPRLVRAVMEATGAEGVNVVSNNGAAAGQEVFHVHFHVIPRSAGDGLVRFAPSAAQMLDSASAEEVAMAIRERLASAGPDDASAPPVAGTPLAMLLDAHALVLRLHEFVHRHVDALVVRVVRALFGRLLG
ncbi:hypothetical protein KFE25_005856 [Diacronema lutheri]|uniref:HIT domain-containing protein n=2 Tax=Diacronema lutheri TaxID=2081491 RepID=A0A8J6CFR9_DIALT|nr:hypothetical protein KFE25_005856 [Diacronema lutheri]